MQKPEMIFIDFDGVIAKNSVPVLIEYGHFFINKYTPMPMEAYKNYFKSTVCFPPVFSTALLFFSLGIGNKISEYAKGAYNLEAFNNNRISIEENFFPFIEFCQENEIPYRIFSLAVKKVKRYSELIKKIGSDNIYNLHGFPKSKYGVFSKISKALNVSLSNCLYIDDAPLALRTGKLHKLNTVMMINDVFTMDDYNIYKDYIDFTVNSFLDIKNLIA